MGMFDSLIIYCPNCGNAIEFQSKAGECTLDTFTIDNVPDKVAGDLIGETQECDKCHGEVKLYGKILLYPIMKKL